MTDIIERLRERAANNAGHYYESDEKLDREAAHEIELLRAALSNDPDADICAENDNLRAEIERLREVVRSMGGTP